MNPQNEPNKQAVLYVRVSSKEQEKEGYSIQSQYKLLRDFAFNQGLEILQEFGDVETAKTSGREGFEMLLAFLKKNPTCKTLLVEKTDRLYRNLKDWVTMDDLGLDIHLVKEAVLISPNSRSGEKFMHGIKVLMAKNYIDNLSEEARKGMTEKAEEGIWPSVAPIGYRNITGTNGRKIIEIDPLYAPIIRKLFEQYASGDYSLKEITQAYKDSGLVFRRSKKPLPVSSIHRMLQTRIYCGEFDWKKKTYLGSHEAIVSKDLWEKVQEVLKRKNQSKGKNTKHSFSYSGLVNCGHCGCQMVGEIKKGKYVYYHCTGHKGNCLEPYTREESLETEFSNYLKLLKLDEKTLALLVMTLKLSHKDKKQFHTQSISRLQAEQTKIQTRLSTMYEDKLDGRITQEFFDIKSKEWKVEMDKLNKAIQNHQRANFNYQEQGIKYLEMAHTAYENFIGQTPVEKRRLVTAMIHSSSWKDGNLDIKFRLPFDVIAVSNSQNDDEEKNSGNENVLSPKWLAI